MIFYVEYSWFSFITLNILCHSLMACKVPPENKVTVLWQFPCTQLLVVFLLLLKFSFHLLFVILIVMHLVVDLFGFILFQSPCAFWIQIFVFFLQVRKVFNYYFFKTSSLSLFLSSLLGPL